MIYFNLSTSQADFNIQAQPIHNKGSMRKETTGFTEQKNWPTANRPNTTAWHKFFSWKPLVRFQKGICHVLNVCVCTHAHTLCRSVVSNSWRLRGLWPTRLLCPWGVSRQEYWSGLPCPNAEDLSDPGIKPRSPTLQALCLLQNHIEIRTPYIKRWGLWGDKAIRPLPLWLELVPL